ncbi:MAG: Intracellular exo-alpha-(1-_5)-L-arabinofuranosidase [Cyanobacteriota bacterium]
MNWNKIKWRSLLVMAMLALALAVVGIPSLAVDQRITVNVEQVVADIDHNLGIGLNFISDRPNISQPLQDIQVETLRYATNEYFLFNPQRPNNPQVAIQDPSIWQVKSFSKPDGTWWSKLNFDQFMEICQATKAEPFIVVGIDAIAYQGAAPHVTPEAVVAAAVDWVKYANLTKGYQIKYWEIGNESNIQHHEQVNWTPEQYGQTVVQLAQAMKAVDPSIKVGANGMRIKQNDDWWSRVMPIVKDNVDFLVTHQYSWQADYPAWRDSTDKYDYNLQDAVKAIATYQPELKLNVTENSSFNPNVAQTNNTWKMLHNFEMLGQTLSIDRVDYAHFWTSRWLEPDPLTEDTSAFKTDYQLTPMGYALKVWNQFLKPKMVNATTTGTVSSWASYDPGDRSLSILLLNKLQTQQNVSVTLNNYRAKSNFLRPWVLQGATPESTDVTWNKSGSAFVWGDKIQLKLEPLSVTAIAIDSSKVD